MQLKAVSQQYIKRRRALKMKPNYDTLNMILLHLIEETYNAPEEVHHSVFIGPTASGGLLRWRGQVTPERPLGALTEVK